MIEKQHLEQNSHISRLTWLRGLAALFVVIAHSIRATEVSYLQGNHVSNFSFFSLLDLGNYGVVLFFALSGCTLYISNYDKISSNSIIQFLLTNSFVFGLPLRFHFSSTSLSVSYLPTITAHCTAIGLKNSLPLPSTRAMLSRT